MKPNYRRCLSCRRVDVKNSFWRVVRVYPSTEVQLDLGQGRSAYICPQESCLKIATQKNRLARALKAPVPQEIYNILRQRTDSKQAPVFETTEATVESLAKLKTCANSSTHERV